MIVATGDTRLHYEHLWWHVYAPVLVTVAVLVFGAVLYASIRFRRRSDELPAQKADDHVKEAVYAVVVACAVAVLVFFTFRTEYREDALAANPALRVQVTAFQWQWRFDYPGHGVSVIGSRARPATLVVPAGETIELSITATDVIHSFWIPELRFKRDANPFGKVSRFDLVFPEAKRYDGHCAEFCGLRHGEMDFGVTALPPERFAAWLASHRGVNA